MNYGGAATDTVVVLTALQLEYRVMRAHLVDPRQEWHPAGTQFDVGRLPDSPWRVVLMVTGAGNEPAAVLTERAVSRYRPRALLVVGVAGALHDDIRLGDVVVSTWVYGYHGGMADDAGFRARPRAWEASHLLDQAARATDVAGDWSAPWQDTPRPTVHFRPIAAGEVVLNSLHAPLAEQLTSTYNDAAAIEMESAGTASAAQRNGSLEVLTIRGISDRADGNKHAADGAGLQSVAAERAAAFAVAMLRMLPSGETRSASRGEPAVPVPDSSPLERLRAISESAVADCDIVAARDDESVVRLGAGAYIRRSVEDKLLQRLMKPAVTALVGEAGHGKTALVWQLHRRLTALGRAPLLLPASALLEDSAGPAAMSVEAIGEALLEGRSGKPQVLLVDTLDLLLHDPQTREQVRRLLAVAERAEVPTLVTSRPVEANTLSMVDDEQALDSAPADGRIGRVTLSGYDRRERPEAIAAYARLFYSPAQAGEVARVLENASVRGLPLQEVCRNPLALRLLFEVYAPDEMPPSDIDSIGLHDKYWQRRINTDDRGRHIGASAPDLSRYAEGAGLALLSTGSIEASHSDLIERVRPLAGDRTEHDHSGPDKTESAIDALHTRGVFKTPPNSRRLRFFHQTFFEHAAARAVLTTGEPAVRVLLDRVQRDPNDLFYGEVAAQLILLAQRRLVVTELTTTTLHCWLTSDNHGLRILASRTYARMPDPPEKLRAAAAEALRTCEVDMATDYLHLLPSVHHASFDRLATELGILWRRTLPPATEGGPGPAKDRQAIAINVLDALSRLAATHPDDVIDFLTEHDCLTWLRGLPIDEWRNHDSVYLRLLEPLYPHAPRWCGSTLTEFFVAFAAKGKVEGAAEILELFARHASPPLDESAAAKISVAVRRLDTEENTKRLEVAYAELRAPWFTGLTAAELVDRTSGVLGNLEWTLCGRRAELRAICRAALELSDDQAREFLDAVLQEEDRTRQEDVCTIVGETLAVPGPDPSALTRYARERSRRELSRLPARRRRDGSRPVPMLFVNALYGARVGGAELSAALPEDVPTELWSGPDGLMPLLAPAALAHQPTAVATLTALLATPPGAALPVRDAKVPKSVLGRLREAAYQGIPEAFGHLIDHAEATGDVTVVCAVLDRPETARVHPLADHQDRLDRLRRRLLTSTDRAVIASGHKLWRVLVEHHLGTPPTPGDIVAALSRRPSYPTLMGLFELTNACLRSGRWSGHDVTPVIDALTPYTEHRRSRRTTDVKDPADQREAQSAKRVATAEMWARRLMIGLHARHAPLGHDAIHQRNQADKVLELIKDADYNLEDSAELDAFTGCMTEAGRLVERINDPVTIIDLILNTAAWLHDLQPKPTRWRRRTAQAWHPAIAAAVAGSSQRECRRLIDGLLTTDREMARLAVAACVDHLRPIPGWLQELAHEMPPEVHRRMREVLNRNARDGSPRPLAELYAVAAAASPVPRE